MDLLCYILGSASASFIAYSISIQEKEIIAHRLAAVCIIILFLMLVFVIIYNMTNWFSWIELYPNFPIWSIINFILAFCTTLLFHTF